MNPNTPQPSREEIEVRLTALILGELPPAEAELLRWSIAQDAELAKLHDQLKSTIGLVREVAANPEQTATQPGAPLKMSEERRQKLLAHFKTVTPREFTPAPAKSRRKTSWLVPLAAVLVISVVLAAMLLPALSHAKRGRMSLSSLGARYDAAEQKTLSVTKSLNSPRRGTYGGTPETSSDGEVLATNSLVPTTGVGFDTYALNKTESQPLPATPIVLPPASPSHDSLSESPNIQPVVRSGTGLPASGGFVSGNLNDADGGFGGFGGGGFGRGGSGGGGGGGGNDGKPSVNWADTSATFNPAPPSLARPAGYGATGAAASSLPPGGIYSQHIVGYVNTPLAGQTLTVQDRIQAGLQASSTPENQQRGGFSIMGPLSAEKSPVPANPSDTFAQYEFQPSPGEVTRVPAAGEGRRAAKKSKDNGVSLADTLNSTHGIVLPPDSGGDGAMPIGGSTFAANPANPNYQGNLDNSTRAPATATYDNSGAFAYDYKKLDQNGGVGGGGGGGGGADRQLRDQQVERAWARSGQKAFTPTQLALANRSVLPPQPDIDPATGLPRVAAKEAEVAAAALPSPLPEETPRTERPKVEPPQNEPFPMEVPPPAAIAAPASEVQTIASVSGAVVAEGTASSHATMPVLPIQAPATPPTDTVFQEAVIPADDLAVKTAPVDVSVPQPEVATKDNAFSTFSLNVSDVSFKLAAASLEHNVFPQPGSIRSEEFINAFDYRDPEPPAGAPVGFAWERAGDPFAHNRDFLRFSVKTAAEGRAPGRPLNLVLLLDKSGSMERADRAAIIHEALRVLATQLGSHDTLSVITFARTARMYVDGARGDQAQELFDKVSGITPQGGTNLEEAMNLAYQTALRHFLEGGVNRVVLMTDGAANLGNVDPQHFKQKVEANRKQGIALDCFGIGWEDYNDNLLELLASHGDGRYGFLNTPEEASSGFATQLAGALKVAAADVKVQVEFNPARVTAYRQIGYATHQLTKQQFRDNTVDAAVIGAAESGNGLYTVQINPQGDGPVATVRVRFRKPGTTEVQEHSWLVPYTGTAVALDQASPAIRLAATAGTFAEWLASSPYAADVTSDELIKYLAGVPEVYGTDPRPKQLERMIRQAKNFAGKE